MGLPGMWLYKDRQGLGRGKSMKCNTDDGIDHGDGQLQDCFEAVITKYEDGYILCPILWSGGSCEECMAIFERRQG